MKTKLFKKINLPPLGGGLGWGFLLPLFWRGLGGGLLLLCPVILSAQNGVTVSNLAVHAGAGGAPTTVTFNVSWDRDAMPVALWSDSVWVFVDYNHNGTMKRLPLLPGAMLTNSSWDGAYAEEIADNDQGIWVVGNARTNGNFSATVQLCTRDAINRVSGGACAYASNYPPVAEYITVQTIKFTGTPPYDLMLSSGTTTAWSDYNLLLDQTLVSFTDKTGAPGIITPLTYTLTASAAGFCEGTTDGVSFALQGTQKGVKYQLYRDAALAGTLTGTGSAATFSDTFITAGTYTVRTVAEGAYQTTLMSGSHTITSNPLPTEPVIAKPADVSQGGTLVFTATGYSGALTWTSVTAGGSVSGSSVTFTNVTAGTKSVTAQSAQTYTNAPTCYSATVTQSTVVTTSNCTSPGQTVNFTAFNPCANASINSVWYLTDTRAGGHNNTYKVKLMGDNRIWMVQDLKFGNCGAGTTTWRNDNSATAVATQPTVYADASSTYVGHCRTNDAGDVYFYNWPAAMNNVLAFDGSSDNSFACSGTLTGSSSGRPASCRGICPVGWHIPTQAEYDDANVKFQTYYNCTLQECWLPASAWSVQHNGIVSSTGAIEYTAWGVYITSSACSARDFGLVNIHPNQFVPYCGNTVKSRGPVLRCVKNY